MQNENDFIQRIELLNVNEYRPINNYVEISKPLVSVSIATFNHSLYIEQCIESILNQITDFDYEIVIGEDESNDGTREICIKYANLYPNKIRLLLRNRNESCIYNKEGRLIRSLNGISTMLNCKGQYIALCEGDDYWTDMYKLQKQYNVIKSKNVIFVGHFTSIFNQKLNKEVSVLTYPKNNITLEDTVLGPPTHTSSFFFKNILGKIKFDFKLPSGDDFLACELLKRGNGYILFEKMSVYRLSDAGTWSTISNVEKTTKSLYIQLWIIKNVPKKILLQLYKIGGLYLSLNNRSVLKIKISFFDLIIILMGVLIINLSKLHKWLKK